MISSVEELAGLLSGTALASFELGASPVCEGEPHVLVVGPIPSDQDRQCLRISRGLSAMAERWPVWVCNFATVVGESVFWESEFARGAPGGAEITPEAIADRALAADEAGMFAQRANRLGHDLDEELRYYVEGEGPTRGEVVAAYHRGEIPSVGEIGRWILDWRLDHVPEDSSVTDGVRRYSLDYWHQEHDGHLFFLPTPDPWRVTSYLNFFGSSGELSTLLLKKWFDKWGARVVAHSGTMMNFEVANPPRSLDEAAEVAWEHYLLAQCTTILPGIGLHEYAHALVGHTSWHLHERP